MAVKIRLTRMGDKKSPFYRLVATDGRVARDGKYIENLGTYNPMTNPAKVDIKKERVEYWLGCGAIPTDTAKELLVKEGLVFRVVRNREYLLQEPFIKMLRYSY